MRNHIRRIDSNQKALVNVARRIGASVAITSSLGNGFPDVVIGYRGKNFLVEFKTSSKNALTLQEGLFHMTWEGKIDIVTNQDELIDLLSKC